MGGGVVDFPSILRLLKSLSADVTLSVEDHAGSFLLPIFDAVFLSKFPDLTAGELSRLIRLSQMTSDRPVNMADREQWPGICEQRIADDLAALKVIASAVV
jgi:hypothetical protein